MPVDRETGDLLQHPVFRHFHRICQIPHGSGNEKALSDELVRWAGEQGLEAVQDRWNNVLVRKPASPGYENAPAVMLQAHIDMVCEKAEGVDHDFTKDPISWAVEGNTLSTGGKTTLGADDGIGVALILAVLEDRTLAHPALEALFTTGEEEDMSGAEGFDSSLMQATRLINLDNTVEQQIMCGSCGGMEADLRIPLSMKPVPDDSAAFRLAVTGLKGGHSGEDIHRGRGSANAMLTRLLLAVTEICPALILSIRGGTFRLAIPRDAEAVIAIPRDREEDVRTALAEMEGMLRQELAVTADSVQVSLEPAPGKPIGADPGKVLDALMLVPDGICQMNEALTGLVDTSDNLGEVRLSGEELHMVLEIRSARESLRTWLYQRMERLASLLGGSCTCCSPYPSWNFRSSSKLRDTAADVYRRLRGREPELLTVHAGLEVGYLLERRPEVDAISLGPDCRDFHSPSESLDIGSVMRFYPYLTELLAALR